MGSCMTAACATRLPIFILVEPSLLVCDCLFAMENPAYFAANLCIWRPFHCPPPVDVGAVTVLPLPSYIRLWSVLCFITSCSWSLAAGAAAVSHWSADCCGCCCCARPCSALYHLSSGLAPSGMYRHGPNGRTI